MELPQRLPTFEGIGGAIDADSLAQIQAQMN